MKNCVKSLLTLFVLVNYLPAQFTHGLIVPYIAGKSWGFRTGYSISLNSKKDNEVESRHSIDYQSDTNLYGRGDMHLSADLDENDLVAYQIGTWEVDGVEVGDGEPASLKYCVVENLQVVWTHNCEHGVIRGMAVCINTTDGSVDLLSPLEFVDFGPEQLVARLPIEWIDEDQGKLLVSFPEDLQNLV